MQDLRFNRLLVVIELGIILSEKTSRYQRYRGIFTKFSLKLIDRHDNWLMIIDANIGDDFIAYDEKIAVQKAREL